MVYGSKMSGQLWGFSVGQISEQVMKAFIGCPPNPVCSQTWTSGPTMTWAHFRFFSMYWTYAPSILGSGHWESFIPLLISSGIWVKCGGGRHSLSVRDLMDLNDFHWVAAQTVEVGEARVTHQSQWGSGTRITEGWRVNYQAWESEGTLRYLACPWH